MITAAKYAAISLVIYVIPDYSGVLTISPGTAQHEATSLCTKHKELIQILCEAIGVENLWIKQVVPALEIVLESLHN